MSDGPLFRFSGPHGATIAAAAIYRAPGGPRLFLWLGRRVYSWRLRWLP